MGFEKQLSYADWKARLKEDISVGKQSILFRWKEKKILSFNCLTQQYTSKHIDLLPEYDEERFEFLNDSSIFISGGRTKGGLLNHWFWFYIKSEELIRKANMIIQRSSHGMVKFGLNIYVFGGYILTHDSRVSETYDIENDYWRAI